MRAKPASASGNAVVTLVSDQELELEAEVPSGRLAGVKPGALVKVRLDDDSVHAAKVRAVIPDENPAARTRPVRLVPEFSDLKVPVASNQTVTL